MKIGIVGLGFVGGSIYKSLKLKGFNIKGYDKYKNSDPLFEMTVQNIINITVIGDTSAIPKKLN